MVQDQLAPVLPEQPQVVPQIANAHTTSSNTINFRWQPPSYGWVKFNIDASF